MKSLVGILFSGQDLGVKFTNYRDYMFTINSFEIRNFIDLSIFL